MPTVATPPLFTIETPHGTLVAVHTDDALFAALHPDEAAHAEPFGEARRRWFAAGRAAMRVALAAHGRDAGPILADDRGAPILPEGLVGSISHKDCIAVALLADAADGRVGVDVELDVDRPIDVARRVLTNAELDAIAGLDARARARAVLRRFSVKEAIYKAIDPFLRRYVGFREVEPDAADPRRFVFIAPAVAGEPALDIEADIATRTEGTMALLLATARARLARTDGAT